MKNFIVLLMMIFMTDFCQANDNVMHWLGLEFNQRNMDFQEESIYGLNYKMQYASGGKLFPYIELGFVGNDNYDNKHYSLGTQYLFNRDQMANLYIKHEDESSNNIKFEKKNYMLGLSNQIRWVNAKEVKYYFIEPGIEAEISHQSGAKNNVNYFLNIGIDRLGKNFQHIFIKHRNYETNQNGFEMGLKLGLMF